MLLPVIAIASYLTSFLRERYLIQRALGTSQLDDAVAAYALAGLLGNLYAIALGMIWLDGRRIPRIATQFIPLALVGLLLGLAWHNVGAALMLASLIAMYEFARQKTAMRGRQASALLASVLAPAATVAVWHAFPKLTLSTIILGYATGYLVQAAASEILSLGATPLAQVSRSKASFLWPLLFAIASQINGLLDRLLFPLVGQGWAAAGSFSLQLAAVAMLVVVAPLASEAIAGRLPHHPSRQVMTAAVVFTAIIVTLAPFGIPLLVHGGAVSGIGLHRVITLSIIYLLGIPALGYGTFRSRTAQANAHSWKMVAVLTLVAFGAHLLVSIPAALLSMPYLVPVGWLVSTYLSAWLYFSRLPRAPGRPVALPVPALTLPGTQVVPPGVRKRPTPW